VIDIKGELLRYTRAHSERVFGKENVHVFNALDPTKTDVLINPLKSIAEEYATACLKSDKAVQKRLISQAETKLRMLINELFPQTDFKTDRSWQDIARQLLLGIAIGLMEDQKKISSGSRRVRLSPKDITIAKMREVYESFETSGYQGNEFDDKGFFTSRKKSSNACKYSRVALNNAGTTRLNYLGFAGDMFNQYADPKIEALTSDNNFDFNTLTQTPQMLYILVNFADVVVRECVNKLLTVGINTLLESDYDKGNLAQNVPVNFIIDEFSTMMPDSVYPNVLATGRGSKIFLTMVVQSLSQLEARYSSEWKTMTENCNLQIFVGTNDENTAERFSDELGKTTVPDPIAYLNGKFNAITVPAVSQDHLMHRMQPGEVFIKVHGGQPIHGHNEYYYKTEEYVESSIGEEPETDADDDAEESFFDCIDDFNADTVDYEESDGCEEHDFDSDDDLDYDFRYDDEEYDDETADEEYDDETADEECDDDGDITNESEDVIEFENKCMDEIEKIILISEDNDRQEAIEIAKQRLRRARNPERIKILERVVKEFVIATDVEFDLLKKQLFS
ncbi:MAG: type IV secretory system conjugative DNA transfer family protein, partial [Clostridiales bacterium]|nr:type IV secretory system conjugative DNA transfer family protein [Clostridiales bacterium]